jgi:hypothetical protein
MDTEVLAPGPGGGVGGGGTGAGQVTPVHTGTELPPKNEQLRVPFNTDALPRT